MTETKTTVFDFLPTRFYFLPTYLPTLNLPPTVRKKGHTSNSIMGFERSHTPPAWENRLPASSFPALARSKARPAYSYPCPAIKNMTGAYKFTTLVVANMPPAFADTGSVKTDR